MSRLQLEDEALKHIGAYCPELVTLNLQTCSVSRSNECRLVLVVAGKVASDVSGEPIDKRLVSLFFPIWISAFYVFFLLYVKPKFLESTSLYHLSFFQL